ncbi:MAG: hypothetical protein IT360_12775 [Gemmatimonadaceae bacterium]|nr:hypothetical protein [Gemmatimonadaceae bacterium]
MYRLSTPLVFLSAALAFAPPAGAQGDSSPWAPWIGCWDLVPRASAPTTSERVCVLPTENPAAVDLVSLAGDSIVTRQHLDATAAKREMTEGDCAGVEDVQATGARVYLRTTMRCGEQNRLVTSVMAMSRDGEWIDVRGVAFGENVGVRASRYRQAPASAQLPAEVASALEGRPRGMYSARLAASGPVQLRDVVEAARFLEVGVLQTWLAERGQGFGLNAQSLEALEGSGVSPMVIDIMVALSYPDVFALDRTALGDPPPDTRGEMRGGEYGGGGYDRGGYDRGGYYGGGYGYDPYGYGYGRGYGWYSGSRPIVVVQRPADATVDEHGKVVKGRGYVSPRNGSSGSANSGGSSGGNSSGTAGRASGDSDKGTSTGRKAKPKKP